MSGFHFRTSLNSYEVVLAQWAMFTVEHGLDLVRPTGMEMDEDGSVWLIHQVKDSQGPIRCNDGQAVRLLRLGLPEQLNQRLH